MDVTVLTSVFMVYVYRDEAQLRPYYACMQRELRGTRCAVTRVRSQSARRGG